ncbi:TPA: replication/maintenance protein RepL, partial [Klebsiella pneumoniae]
KLFLLTYIFDRLKHIYQNIKKEIIMITKSRVHENVEDITEVLNSKKIKDKIDEMQERGDVKATVIIQDDKKISLKNEFVILFLENFDRLITELKINTSELRVLIYILKKMEFGNLVSLSQASIVKALDMNKSNVSIIFKKLLAKDVLIKDEDGNMYVNSNIVMKGLKHKLSGKNKENLQKSQKQTDLFDKSH